MGMSIVFLNYLATKTSDTTRKINKITLNKNLKNAPYSLYMNKQQTDYIKSFLMKCKIAITNFDDLNGMIIPREIFLDTVLYNSVKEDISILKHVFTSSALTSLQSNAEENQKWPFLNLVRQILRSCHYKMTPKRISAGYTKEGKKIYNRVFIVEKLAQTDSTGDVIDSSTTSSLVSSTG